MLKKTSTLEDKVDGDEFVSYMETNYASTKSENES